MFYKIILLSQNINIQNNPLLTICSIEQDFREITTDFLLNFYKQTIQHESKILWEIVHNPQVAYNQFITWKKGFSSKKNSQTQNTQKTEQKIQWNWKSGFFLWMGKFLSIWKKKCSAWMKQGILLRISRRNEQNSIFLHRMHFQWFLNSFECASVNISVEFEVWVPKC